MSDDEIEFLDEDADIVQQCVQLQPTQVEIEIEPPAHFIPKQPKIEPSVSPLLVERAPPTRRKRKKVDEDDSDYDPSLDIPQRTARSRRRRVTNTPRQSTPVPPRVNKFELIRDITTPRKVEFVESAKTVKKPSYMNVDRRNLTIRIPDFDDPLCLPVRAIIKDENDVRRLRHWNNLCLEQFKTYDQSIPLKGGEVTSSKRTVVIRNIFNKQSGKTETTFFSKILVENKAGETKSDIVKSVMPRYREKKILNSYKLLETRKLKPFNRKFEVILTKERDGKDEMLVAYKPDESLSMIFKLFETNNEEADGVDEEQKRYIEEMASCKMCAPCYQTSWRGVEKNVKRDINCQICGRSCISIHNLFTHLKVHSPAEIKRHKKMISSSIAKILKYHYQCRVCQSQFLSIKDLRAHVRTHTGTKQFHCEIGNHLVCP